LPTSLYEAVQERIKGFDFKRLFIEDLLWNHFQGRPLEANVEGTKYVLTPVAQRGMAVYECVPDSYTEFPKYSVRRRIDAIVSKTAREHIIIFHDSAKTVQIWQWVRREAGKPSACREQIYYSGQSGDALAQKVRGIAFGLDDEANVTATVARVGSAFDVEKVTRKFYDEFKTEHDAFLKFVTGIPGEKLPRWYASVMLNRLMFVYFIQKKGFLVGNQDYLAKKLLESKSRGRDKFYREFLCRLFFDGFAKFEDVRDVETHRLLGAVPYLNGSLFVRHQIEAQHGDAITIPDAAFERIFRFFEEWDWHLDDRPSRSGREINPDVLGYVFEKYINQKDMGAYYSKEDITEYISKNTIIPALFDMARASCRIAFDGEHTIWQLLTVDSDRYMHAAALHGLDNKLPDSVSAGVGDVSKRGDWNKAAPPEYALPTETWREIVARRTHAESVRAKLFGGDVRSVADLITYNLDIRRFAEEVIADCEGPELLRAFYYAIRGISVLDPTCGSGAFLFAALNILERLYDTCLVRMQAFVDDADRSSDAQAVDRYRDFRDTLAEMNDKARHPSPRYFILKSIVLNNLYGVDIMEEATEICKLRLFLKLVSQVSPGDKIEPLPDIDFNIRAGNTLVGFATEEELIRVLGSRLDFENSLDAIKERAELAENAYGRFREMQTGASSSSELDAAKRDVRSRLEELRSELNVHLAAEYGVKASDRKKFAAFQQTFQPFHWFVEFYGIMRCGGFDVIIGNPPYVEYKKVKGTYSLLADFQPYATNLYAACSYRSVCLKNVNGYASFVVPVSLASTDRMQPLRTLLTSDHALYHISFSTRPDKLFDGAEQRLTIYIQCPGRAGALYSGGYRKWYSEERPYLFDTIDFVETAPMKNRHEIWPKIRGAQELALFAALAACKRLGETGVLASDSVLYYKNTGIRYFSTVTLNAPKCWINGKRAPSSRETTLRVAAKYKHAVHAYLISSLFFYFYQATSNCRDLNPSDIVLSPFPALDKALEELNRLSREAESEYKSKAKMIRMNNKKTGLVEIESMTPATAKGTIDKIDRALGRAVGLSNELIDYVVNLDVKYRMGADALGEGVEDELA
jgi:hypothetical protein